MAVPNFAQLKSVLLTSGLQQKDNALYQVINQLLTFMSQFQANVNTAVSGGGSGSGGGASVNSTFITEVDESGTLPNSRRLMAGDFISLDVATPNQEIVNGAEWSVLTNGDPVNPELIFAGGDVIMTHIP